MQLETSCRIAFKEWAAVCGLLAEGRQTLLLRKGGIREEGGTFEVAHSSFWLMPTFEHQSANLLQEAHQSLLPSPNPAPGVVHIRAYAEVAAVHVVDDDELVWSMRREYPWNRAYVKQRFDFNPYDPLYAIVLRVWNVNPGFTVPMLPRYEGCKSWVELDMELPTSGAVPAVSDEEFAVRRDYVAAAMASGKP